MATSSGKPTDSNGGASAKDKEAELAAKLAAFESEIAALGAVTAAAASSGAASGAGAGSTGDGVASAPAKPGAAGPAAVKQGRSDDEGSAQPAKKPRIVTSVVASAAPAGPSRPPSGYQSGGIGGAVSGGHTTESLLAMAGYVNPAAGAPGAAAAAPGTGALGAAGGVSRAPGASGGSVPARRGGTFIRTVAGKTWEDKTLAEWPANDFRLFVGNVAPDCTEPMLTRLFSKYPSFAKCKVMHRGVSKKAGYFGFVSFLDPSDASAAMREFDGKFVGSRPIKLTKSKWKDRDVHVVKQKAKQKAKLGL